MKELNLNKVKKRTLLAAIVTSLSFYSMAQEPSVSFLENKLAAHRNKTLQEKLFVHTDKKTYLAGEFLWFRVYDVEGYTHQPLHLSRLAYVELLNAGDGAVVQAKVSLKAGEENGSLYLPLNLPTGIYKLRAYTNWMKNFGPEFFFEKEINVINPLSNAKTESKVPDENEADINFFPEGGYLVKDLPATLAFKGNDAYGRGLDFKGWILNEKADTVAALSPLKFGMGSMLFTPVGGHRYTASVLFSNGKRVKKDLPQVVENGYAMHLQKTGVAQLTISVKTSLGNPAGQVFLVAHTREVIRVAEQATLKNGTAVFTINAARLEPGITQFTIFDAAHQPVAERLYFTPPRDGWKAEVQTGKKEYAAREKINLPLRTLNTKGLPAPASLSLSVFRVDSLQVPDDMNIENYLLLTSDLTGRVESPAYYFGQPEAEREQATDNLMLTQGWRRFRWQNVLREQEPPAAAYPLEFNGPLVLAKVYNAATGQPAAGLQTYLSLPGKQYQVYFSESDSAGQVQFELNDHYGAGEMIVRPFTADDSLYRVELQSTFSQQYTALRSPSLALAERAQDLLANYSVGMQVRQVYAGDSLNHFTGPQRTDTFSYLGVPDYTYNLDDYTRFTTMEEVLREYVRPINVGSRKGRPHMIFVNEVDRTPYDENLLVMLDGVPLRNADRVFDYDPLKVQKLEIFPRAYVLGSGYFFGVANFATYKGSFDASELDPKLIALDYQGLQMQREFYAPVYDTPAQKASRLPDYRNTLYWNPNVQTSAEGNATLEFYSCDQKGHYLGVLQGTDNNGHPVVGQFVFEVK